MNWYLQVLKKYAVFSGRARRKEFWMFVLFNVIVSVILGILDAVLFNTGENSAGVLGSIYSLVVLIPSLAVSVRRLHDIGRTGWWVLVGLIPILGWIVLIIFYVKEGDPGANEYGPNPKEIGYNY
jgi:uncharacterized membrane protein YhaH (DUF805 family)